MVVRAFSKTEFEIHNTDNKLAIDFTERRYFPQFFAKIMTKNNKYCTI